MTSTRGRWGRLKLAQSASDDEMFNDSPVKSPRPSRFRRKSSDSVFDRRNNNNNNNNNSELEDAGEGRSPRKRSTRFRRESGNGADPSNKSSKKGLFARQREKRKEKKKKRRKPKDSGVKSDGDSADEDSAVGYGTHKRYEMDDASIEDYGASADDNYNSDTNYHSEHYHSDTQLVAPVQRSPKKNKRSLAELRRQQFQEQQLALEIQRQNSKIEVQYSDQSSVSVSESKTAVNDLRCLSLDDMPLGMSTSAAAAAPPPPSRKKVSFGESALSEEKSMFASQPLASAFYPKVPPAPTRAHTADEVLDLSEVDGSSIDYNAPDYGGPPSPTPAFNSNQVSRRMSRERARYSIYHGSVKKRFRVRPYHCFADKPVSMTEEEIYADSLKPSDNFIQLRSYLAPTSKSVMRAEIPDNVREHFGAPDQDGRIGALKVEVLGCVSLNRTKPDVSVYLVCGDAAFCTDVLNGYRSPMWPSVSRRACVIPLHHAYAKLYVGVFDGKKRKNKENDVFCGRVAIDLASIRPDTEYDTTLPLRASALVYDKRKRGVIRIRFSLHWFNERAAVMSYFKSVRSLVDSCPLVEGQPAIPCADPKTFRNVAVTVYGQDLPGKYSRNAFRATVREFNLYQQNLRLLVKTLVLDAMLYEQPWMSLYLFGAAMYCVLLSSVRMVPAFFLGYIIILYIENYRHFIENKDFQLGYKPLTILEIGKALVLNSEYKGRKQFSFEPATVQKRIRKRHGRGNQKLRRLASAGEEVENGASGEENDGEIKPMDHREFPFSERDAYPRFSVEDALAPGSSKSDTGRLHGRLSVYYTPEAAPAASGSGDEDNDSAGDSDNDDETIMTESQMIGDNMFDLGSDADEDEGSIEGMDSDYKRAMMLQNGNSDAKRRVRLGPPQDSDVIGRKVPPQLQLKKVENMLNKVSRGIAVELVHAPPTLSASKSETLSSLQGASSTGMTAPSAELQAKMNKKARKLAYDDFDKLLGLQSRGGNPIQRIMSSFMGPLMRMIRVGICLVRLSFNVATWRDPYLSFWVLVGLSLICLILIVFPWRSFFGLLSIICLGPQNIYVRSYLEKKAAAAHEKAMMDESGTTHSELQPVKPLLETSNNDATKKSAQVFGRSTSITSEDSYPLKADNVKKSFLSKFRVTKAPKVDAKQPLLAFESFHDNETENGELDEAGRPAFSSLIHGSTSSNKKIEPRAVAIPYTRLNKDRFHDWPPDPTVSRATAMDLYPETMDEIDSLTASVPEVVIPDQEDEVPASLRRRHVPESGIPMSISF